MINSKIPLLFVRYAPGSAGNFLISILQTSNKLPCWDIQVENSKSTLQFEEFFKNWFSKCFQPDLENHIKYEPHHPYQLDFVSAKHPRGDDLSVEEFIEELKNRQDQLFLSNIQCQQQTVMRLNKSNVPRWGLGNPIINIVVDSLSKKWFYKIRYIKLFGRDSNGWLSKENHPDYLLAKFKKIQFRNIYHFQISKFALLKNFVIGESAVLPFYDYNKLLEPTSNQHCKQYKVNLSNLLDPSTNVDTILWLFEQLELGEPNKKLIEWACNHYYQYNIAPININNRTIKN
jgi:hypothetical protein